MSDLSAKNDKDMERHILNSNDWRNSQGIAEDAKCCRFCLTAGDDAHLWYESTAPVRNDWDYLQGLFKDSSLNEDTYKKNFFKDRDPSNLMNMQILLTLIFCI